MSNNITHFVMDKKKAIAILKKVYHHTNTDYETTYHGEIGYKTDFLTANDHLILKDAGLIPNSFEVQTHDTLLNQFIEIKNDKRLTQNFVTALFLHGLTGNFPRYRQPLMSYSYLSNISNHTFEKSHNSMNCAICGLPPKSINDQTHDLFTYHLGHSWNEMPASFISDLKEILEFPTPKVSEMEVSALQHLLKEIAKAKKDETPGQLEKRIAKSKLLPKTDKYKRYGILQTLAAIGILPSHAELDTQNIRTDIVMPLAGWKGKLGVDFKKATQIFNIAFK